MAGLDCSCMPNRSRGLDWTPDEWRMAFLAGVTITGLTASAEMFWFNARPGIWLRRLPLLFSMVVHALVLTLLVVLGLYVNRRLHVWIEGTQADWIAEPNLYSPGRQSS